MEKLMIRCPITGRAVSTGMIMGRSVFDRQPLSRNLLVCPACRQPHTWGKKDVLPFKD